jgi:hypothetical protein
MMKKIIADGEIGLLQDFHGFPNNWRCSAATKGKGLIFLDRITIQPSMPWRRVIEYK